MKIIWFVVGGWFFLCFPIATNFPRYRYLVDPAKWILWDIPTDAEWSIEFLQRKALEQQKKIDLKQPDHTDTASSDDESSRSEYETPMSSPQRIVSSTEAFPRDKEMFKFRAYQDKSRGCLIVGRNGVSFKSRTSHWSIPYSGLIEMCKVDPEPRIKTLTFGIASSGLRFIANEIQGVQAGETITVREDKRNEIFNIVLGWSGLKWRAVCMQRHKGETASSAKKYFKGLN